MSSDLSHFEIAAGSVTGRAHVLAGRNNQDAFASTRSPHALVAVVADGCSGGAHSELGAQLGARYFAALLQRRLAVGEAASAPSFWQQVQRDLLAQLGLWSSSLGDDMERTVADAFLFTLVALIVTPQTTWLVAVGDGLAALNDHLHHWGPFPGNAPPYLGYSLFSGARKETLTELAPSFSVPTSELRHALVGTDGTCDLGNSVESFRPYWEDDLCFRNPDMIRRRLMQRTRPPTGGGDASLQDDTTVVVVRRRRDEA